MNAVSHGAKNKNLNFRCVRAEAVWKLKLQIEGKAEGAITSHCQYVGQLPTAPAEQPRSQTDSHSHFWCIGNRR